MTLGRFFLTHFGEMGTYLFSPKREKGTDLKQLNNRTRRDLASELVLKRVSFHVRAACRCRWRQSFWFAYAGVKSRNQLTPWESLATKSVNSSRYKGRNVTPGPLAILKRRQEPVLSVLIFDAILVGIDYLALTPFSTSKDAKLFPESWSSFK